MGTPLIAFVVLAAAILYTLAGYPLLLQLRPSRPIRKKFLPRRVTILLAVRDGERWLERKLGNLAALEYPRDLVEVIVISDGSVDATEAIAERWRDRGVRLLRCPAKGKSAALSAGIAAARGEILLFTDVRQELEGRSLRELVSCFEETAVGVVSGELVIREGNSQEESSVGLYWKYEKWIRLRLSAIDSIFGATGCIYAMRRELAAPMPAGILLDDVFLPMAAFFRGFRLIVEPAAKAFDAPTLIDAEFRRKVRTQAGVYQLLRYYPQLVGSRNRMWIDFLSYKLARLLLPWLLLAVFAVSWILPWPWRAAAFAQLVFYAAAALDFVVAERSGLKRVTSPIRAFVVLVAAAACAVCIFAVPPEQLWKAPARRT